MRMEGPSNVALSLGAFVSHAHMIISETSLFGSQLRLWWGANPNILAKAPNLVGVLLMPAAQETLGQGRGDEMLQERAQGSLQHLYFWS